MIPQRVVRIELSYPEAAKLLEVTEAHEDEGPLGEGWPSALLESVRAKVRTAVNETWRGVSHDALL